MTFMPDERQASGWRQRLAQIMGVGGGAPADPSRPWEGEDQSIAGARRRRQLAETMLAAQMQQRPFGALGGLGRAMGVIGANRAMSRADKEEAAATSAREARMADAFTRASAPGADGQTPGFGAQLAALQGNADPNIRRLALAMTQDRMARGVSGEVDSARHREDATFDSGLRVDEQTRMTPVMVDRERQLGPVEAENAGLSETSRRTAAEPFEVRADERRTRLQAELDRIRRENGADAPGTPVQARQLAVAFGNDWEQAMKPSRELLADPKVAFVRSAEGRQLIEAGDAAAIGQLRYAIARLANGPGVLATADVTMADGSTFADNIQGALNSLGGRGRMSAAQAQRILGVLDQGVAAEQRYLDAQAQTQRAQAREAGVPDKMLGLVTPLWAPSGGARGDATAPAGGDGGVLEWERGPDGVLRQVRR